MFILYIRNMSLNPKVWGKHSWIFLHSITLSYPNNPTKQDKKKMKEFFHNVGDVLPCHNCRDNYIKHLKELPIDSNCLESKEALVKWLLEFHNKVNETTGKPTITYEELLDKYSKMYENKNNNIYIYIIILVILIGVLYYLRSRKIKV
jgi:hypothetical protein